MAREESGADRPRHHWPSFLRGGERDAIFARLSESDPLRLRERTAVRMRRQWLLLEPDRAYARAMALCADGAATEDAPPDLEAWTLAKVDLALEQLLRDDAERERAQEPPSAEELLFPMLTQSLLIDPRRVRSITSTFNALDPLTRRAFFELMIEGLEVTEVIENGPWDADQLHDHITLCLRTLGYNPPGRERSLVDRYPKSRKEPQ